MAWYKSGTVTIALNATSVTGIGTKFATNARVGDGFRAPNGDWYEITNIASETTLGIYPAYAGPAVTASANYVIAPIQGYVKESADRLRQITDQIADVADDVAAAEQSAQDSATSALASATSATASSTSASQASTSANNAKTSETNSKTSETNAALSKTAAASSATSATASQTAAATSATNANTSATAASASATAAATSATNSSTSATAANASQVAANTSQTAAKTSETNSKLSENSATNSQTVATTQATNATTQATNAATSATNALSSQNAAKTSETNSKASETKAKAWADTAENTTVETGKYSALHWAAKAKASSDSAAAVVGARLTSIANAVLAVNDLLIADSTTTMKSLATGSFGRSLLATASDAAARTALGLATAAQFDAQATTTDETAGRLMRVGAFGLGTSDLVDLATSQDWNTIRTTGFYQANGTGNGSPGMSGQLMVMTNSTWYSTHLFSPQDTTGRLYTRSSVRLGTTDAPDFGVWRELAGVDTLTTKFTDAGVGVNVMTTAMASNIGANQDLNNYQTSGFYGQGSNASATLLLNYPVVKAGTLTVKVSGNAITTQEYQEYDTGILWVRSRFQTVWSAWKQVWDTTTLIKTTSTNDPITGRMLKVGDFGLGSGLSDFMPTIVDANTMMVTGWSRIATASTNVPSGAVQGATMMTSVWNNGTAQQVVYYGTRQWQRMWSGGTWTAWSEFSSISAVDAKFFNAGITGSTLTAVANIDSFDLANGIYAVDNITTGARPTGQTYGVVTVTGRNFATGRVVQTWYLTEDTVTNPATTTWKRLNYNRVWGPWIKDATQVDLDLKATAAQGRFTNEVQINSVNALRYVNTGSTYGMIQRMDEGNFYFLLTDSGSPQSSFNTLRPFVMNLANGMVSMNQGVSTLAPSVGDNGSRVPTTLWVNTAVATAVAAGIAGDNTTTTSIRATKYIDKLVGSSAATGAIVMNLTNATVFDYTLSGNTTLSFSNVPTLVNELLTVVVTIRQGATARTLTMPANVTFITQNGTAIATPAINKVQDYIFSTKNGTNWEVRAGANT